MKYAIQILPLIAPLLLAAQQPCVPELDELDPITGVRRVAYATTPAVGVWFVRNGDAVHMEMTLRSQDMRYIANEAPITVLFTDGTQLELRQKGTETSEHVTDLLWELTSYAALDRRQLQQFASKPIQLVRYQLSYKWDVAYNGKRAVQTMKAARCLLEDPE